MIAELINRKQMKLEMKALLADAQIPPKVMLTLYLSIALALNMVDSFMDSPGVFSIFISITVSLILIVLDAGFVLYCMAVRRGERAEFLTLFDGFSFVGKIISLNIVMYFFVVLWSMLFVIPGLVAVYRYRFALYNLYENPGISAFEALDMSKRQTTGYKSQLFMLDMSYFGWGLLVCIPSTIYTAMVSYEMAIQEYADAGFGTLAATNLSSAIPVWGWTLFIGLWGLFISLFYYPVYQCVELGYFEIAKRTSGIGESVESEQEPFQSGGPDNMGGY